MREQGTEELWSQEPGKGGNTESPFWDVSQGTRDNSGRDGWQEKKLTRTFNRLLGLRRQKLEFRTTSEEGQGNPHTSDWDLKGLHSGVKGEKVYRK